MGAGDNEIGPYVSVFLFYSCSLIIINVLQYLDAVNYIRDYIETDGSWRQ